ncbi:MAG: hypothetical protein ACJ74E_08905 [Actinomycetes bacterium]
MSLRVNLRSTRPSQLISHRLFVGAAAVAASALALGLVPSTASGQQPAQDVVVSANPADWTPQVLDGRVNAMVQIGDTVIAGGTFTKIADAGSNRTINQSYLFAFDATSGAIDSRFDPRLDGDVEALAASPDGKSVIVGGAFTSVDNSKQDHLVKIDLQQVRVDNSFKGSANDLVEEIQVVGNDLYVSGRFTQVAGTDRSGMARLDANTGAVDPTFDVAFTDPPQWILSVAEFSVDPTGSKLVAIGNFGKVGGQARVQVAMLDLTTNPVSVADWQTDEFRIFVPGSSLTWCQSNFLFWVRDVDFSPDGSYFTIASTGANRPNRLCDTVSRWESDASGSGQKPSWVAWSGGDSFISLANTGSAVYVGGHNQYMNNPYVDQDCGVCTPAGGAIAREGLAALDPLTGLPYTWNPGRSRGYGVMQFLTTAEGLWLGSDTDRLGGEIRPRIGFFPVDGGVAVPPSVPYALPGDLYNLDAATGQMRRRSYDLTTLGTTESVPNVSWKKARGVFALDGRLYFGWADGTLRTRSFDGNAVGAMTKVNLHGLEAVPEPHTFFIPGTTTPIPSISDHFANMTGAFFADGRMYYTVKKDPRLYYRFFTAESQTVGANLYVASTNSDGVNWRTVRGMTMASGQLVYASADGTLNRVAFDGKLLGVPETIGGPLVDGVDWTSRGFFAFS